MHPVFYLATYFPKIILPDDQGATCISLASEHHQATPGQLFNCVNISDSSAPRTLNILLGPIFYIVHMGTGFSSLQLA